MNRSLSDTALLVKCWVPNPKHLQEEYIFMELIMSIITLGIATLKLLFAVPVLGVLVLLSTFGPIIIRKIKHW